MVYFFSFWKKPVWTTFQLLIQFDSSVSQPLVNYCKKKRIRLINASFSSYSRNLILSTRILTFFYLQSFFFAKKNLMKKQINLPLKISQLLENCIKLSFQFGQCQIREDDLVVAFVGTNFFFSLFLFFSLFWFPKIIYGVFVIRCWWIIFSLRLI